MQSRAGKRAAHRVMPCCTSGSASSAAISSAVTCTQPPGSAPSRCSRASSTRATMSRTAGAGWGQRVAGGGRRAASGEWRRLPNGGGRSAMRTALQARAWVSQAVHLGHGRKRASSSLELVRAAALLELGRSGSGLTVAWSATPVREHCQERKTSAVHGGQSSKTGTPDSSRTPSRSCRRRPHTADLACKLPPRPCTRSLNSHHHLVPVCTQARPCSGWRTAQQLVNCCRKRSRPGGSTGALGGDSRRHPPPPPLAHPPGLLLSSSSSFQGNHTVRPLAMGSDADDKAPGELRGAHAVCCCLRCWSSPRVGCGMSVEQLSFLHSSFPALSTSPCSRCADRGGAGGGRGRGRGAAQGERQGAADRGGRGSGRGRRGGR